MCHYTVVGYLPRKNLELTWLKVNITWLNITWQLRAAKLTMSIMLTAIIGADTPHQTNLGTILNVQYFVQRILSPCLWCVIWAKFGMHLLNLLIDQAIQSVNFYHRSVKSIKLYNQSDINDHIMQWI